MGRALGILIFCYKKAQETQFESKNEKSSFGLRTVEYFDNMVEDRNMKADSCKVFAIIDWPAPSDVRQL